MFLAVWVKYWQNPKTLPKRQKQLVLPTSNQEYFHWKPFVSSWDSNEIHLFYILIDISAPLESKPLDPTRWLHFLDKHFWCIFAVSFWPSLFNPIFNAGLTSNRELFKMVFPKFRSNLEAQNRGTEIQKPTAILIGGSLSHWNRYLIGGFDARL